MALIFAVLALLSYEGAIIILPLVILSDFFVLKVKIFSKRTLLSYVPLLAMSILYPFVRLFAHSVTFGGDYSYSPIHLVPNVVGNFLGYLFLFIFGEPSLYYYNLARTTLREEQLFVGAFIAVALIVLLAVLFLTKERAKKLYSNKNFQLCLFLLLFIFVSLVPFLGLGNISERYSYLASPAFAMLSVLIIYLLSGFLKNDRIRTYVLVFIVALFGIYYYSQINLENQEWYHAGKITNRTLGYLRLYYEGIPKGSTLYFVNVPIRYKQAWVFPVGLSDGIWFIYRDPALKVYEVPTLSKAKEMAGPKPKKTYFFVFDKEGIVNAVK